LNCVIIIGSICLRSRQLFKNRIDNSNGNRIIICDSLLKLCGVRSSTVRSSSSLGKDGCQRYGDGADVHKEEETVEQASNQPPFTSYSILLLGVVQTSQVDPQITIDVSDVTFQTPTGQP